MKPKLVFVYNADSGLYNTLTDIAHKIFSPSTYACNLCAITYGTLSMRGEWKEFIEQLEAELEFLHADELKAKYGLSGVKLPAAFRNEGGKLVAWLSAEQINACTSIAELKALVTNNLRS